MARTLVTIETERLRLVPLSLHEAEAMVHGERPGGARWAPGYPMDGTLVAAGLLLTAEAEGRPLGDWTSYQIVRRSDDVVIGDCGFIHPPDIRGRVHVSVGISQEQRGSGYGSEALRALIEWALSNPTVTRVLADTSISNREAIEAMEAAGMRRAGSDGQIVLYEA